MLMPLTREAAARNTYIARPKRHEQIAQFKGCGSVFVGPGLATFCGSILLAVGLALG